MVWNTNSYFGQQIVLFTSLLVLPCLCDDDYTGQLYKRVKFNKAGRKNVETKFLEPREKDVEKSDKKKGTKEKPHIIPLDFVAEVPAWDDEFDPEKAGLLLHEYLDKIYKLNPRYKTIAELKREVLFQDPLIEKLNPYHNDDIRISRYRRGFDTAEELKNDLLEPEKTPVSKFQLDPKEVWEYTKPTEPPESDINFNVGNQIDGKEADNLELYGDLGDNNDDEYDEDEDDGDNNNIPANDYRKKPGLFF